MEHPVQALPDGPRAAIAHIEMERAEARASVDRGVPSTTGPGWSRESCDD